MGIDITTKAEIPARGVLRRAPSRDKVLEQIRKAVHEAVADPLMQPFVHIHAYEHTLSVMLHPAGSPLEFTWQPDHTIQAWAKTSTAGPGYHHYVVEVLNRVGRTCGLDWSWDGADESGYALTWNYEGLQDKMAELLQHMASLFADYGSKGYSDLAVNMPAGWARPKGAGFVVSPVGPLSQEWWMEVSQADEDRLGQLAEEFYPWWDREEDAAFWRKTGSVLMWCEVPWHPPVDDREREVCEAALECFKRAGTMDPSIEVPKAEMNELQELLARDPDAPAEPPRTAGIGYRRGTMAWPATGEWTVDLPGYFYEQIEEDGSEIVLWFDDRTVRLSSLTVSRKDGQPEPPREMLPDKEPDELRGAEVIDYEQGHLAGWAAIRRAEEDGEQYWQLHGTMAAANTLAIATICYVDSDDKQWAIDAFKSLSHPDPEST